MPAAHERQLPPERYCPLEQVRDGDGAGAGAAAGQPVQLHVLVLLPLIQLLLELWPLQPDGHRPFEQQPFEPRSAVVEHDEEEEELEQSLDESEPAGEVLPLGQLVQDVRSDRS